MSVFYFVCFQTKKGIQVNTIFSIYFTQNCRSFQTRKKQQASQAAIKQNGNPVKSRRYVKRTLNLEAFSVLIDKTAFNWERRPAYESSEKLTILNCVG